MRKFLFYIVCAAFIISGCSSITESGSETVFSTKDNSVQFTFPKDWKLNLNENNYDLQCFSRRED
ncbi:MAG: hypothetical protein LBO62_06885, partial [Endomicrobium sp.]|nr:hypothetical protein [Endomicrobium sp.]